MSIVLIEPAIVSDVFCSDMAEPEDLGDGNFRFTFFTKQKSFLDYAGTTDAVIVARLILPFGAVLHAHRMAGKRLGLVCCEDGRMRLAH